jgi:HK97 family phage prohead protease
MTMRALDEDGLIEGYASVFHVPDMARDVVMPGAFAATLNRRTAPVRMLFQHDPARPVGRWLSMREDANGLWCRGRLALDSQAGADLMALVRAGAVDSLSIGFRMVTGRRDAQRGVRRLVAIDLWEVSIVTFPLNPLARLRAAS